MSVLWMCVGILAVLHSCRGENTLRHELSPGDIIIGGLFSLHLKTNRSKNPGPLVCHDFDIRSFLHSQVMIHAIEELNQRTPRLLPNLTIGYDIYDVCSDVSLAIRATLQLLNNKSDQSCRRSEAERSLFDNPATKVVIGEQSSEVSIAVARIVSLASVSQISYSATSELLSRKYKFPTFFRTVSSDRHQTRGISKLVVKFNWKSVAIVGSDDEYGRYGSESLSKFFSEDKVCVEFMELLSGNFSLSSSESSPTLAELIQRINESTAEAIILFTKDINVEIIMGAAIKSKLNRTWIASDAWSTSTKISTLPGIESAGQVFGFSLSRREVPGFRNYLMKQKNDSFCLDTPRRNVTDDCVLTKSGHPSKLCLDPKCLIKYVDGDYSYSIYLAVGIIADSLKRLLKCDSQRCQRTSSFTALELFEEIKKVNCRVNTTHIYFDENLDPVLPYTIVYWNRSDGNIKTIGEYWPNGKISVPEDLEKAMTAVEVTAYNCFKTCKPGMELRKSKCCGNCVPCMEREFSPGNGTSCQPCGEKQYSMEGQRDKCLNITDEYLNWSSAFAITLNWLAVIGIVIAISFIVLFTVHHGTPIVKAVGGLLALLELLSLLACFCLTFTFHGKPTQLSCRIGLPLFGVAFSLCISCVLANLLQILVTFDFNMKVASWMKKIRPVAVVTVVWGIQLTLSVLWMVFEPPFPDAMVIHTHSVHTCKQRSMGFFGAMIAYLALWAFICFVFAFKSKKLPDLYKNAVLISVSMLLVLIIWIIFVPLILTLSGRNKAGVEVMAILISSYSVLGFHLAPKCYIMVFRKELNNEKAITEHIKKYYQQRGRPVIACNKSTNSK
ncbi:unnamed protein product [Ophioblennius macclurei]